MQAVCRRAFSRTIMGFAAAVPESKHSHLDTHIQISFSLAPGANMQGLQEGEAREASKV
jgi:hypothetical protein